MTTPDINLNAEIIALVESLGGRATTYKDITLVELPGYPHSGLWSFTTPERDESEYLAQAWELKLGS